MRQLWHTGWMHNRVRMVAASFLVKYLLISWTEGEAWFWDTLVDADLANNSASWQWVAGCGFDAAPYFRIFNPMLQGNKFDSEGDYVKKWVPELKNMPKKHIHTPWEAPSDVLSDAGVILGKNYPHPIVDHKAARQRALSAYQEMNAEAATSND
jgi:deoxyribodipyrimidine photo-lyase